jgi:hypothetical protein
MPPLRKMGEDAGERNVGAWRDEIELRKLLTTGDGCLSLPKSYDSNVLATLLGFCQPEFLS